VLLPGRL